MAALGAAGVTAALAWQWFVSNAVYVLAPPLIFVLTTFFVFVRGAKQRERRLLDAVDQHTKKQVDNAVTNTRVQLVTALLEAWPLDRSVIAYRLCQPVVTRHGEVTVTIRAVNQSPHAITVHSPRFVPVSGLAEADEASIRITPIQKRLDPHGGLVDFVLIGTFSSGLAPGLGQNADGTVRERTLAHIFIRGSVTASRDVDQTEAKIHLLTDEGNGDLVQTVEVTR